MPRATGHRRAMARGAILVAAAVLLGGSLAACDPFEPGPDIEDVIAELDAAARAGSPSPTEASIDPLAMIGSRWQGAFDASEVVVDPSTNTVQVVVDHRRPSGRIWLQQGESFFDDPSCTEILVTDLGASVPPFEPHPSGAWVTEGPATVLAGFAEATCTGSPLAGAEPLSATVRLEVLAGGLDLVGELVVNGTALPFTLEKTG